MLPGVYHCNLYGGPTTSQEDFLTPVMIGWKTAARRTRSSSDIRRARTARFSAKSRPAFPYPAQVVYSGSGDVNAATSFVRAEPKEPLNDQLILARIGSLQAGPSNVVRDEGRDHVLHHEVARRPGGRLRLGSGDERVGPPVS